MHIPGIDAKQTIFKFRYADSGPHERVVVFAGEREGEMVNCGTLMFREREWTDFLLMLTESGCCQAAPQRSHVKLEKY